MCVADDSNSRSRRPMKEEQVAQLSGSQAGHRHLTHGQRRLIKSSAFFFKRKGTRLFQNNDLPVSLPCMSPSLTHCITSVGLQHCWQIQITLLLSYYIEQHLCNKAWSIKYQNAGGGAQWANFGLQAVEPDRGGRTWWVGSVEKSKNARNLIGQCFLNGL